VRTVTQPIPAMSNIEPETPYEKSAPPPNEVYVNVTDSAQPQLGHTPETQFNWKRFIKSFKSKDAWFGDYVSLCPLRPRLILGLCRPVHSQHTISHKAKAGTSILRYR